VELLKRDTDISLPICVSIQDLDTKYLTKYDKITEKKIHDIEEVGVINGLWANALGRGGIIPIQTMFYPSQSFLELKLTGMQGDVMKESMTVAKSLAWSLLTDEERTKCITSFEKTKEQGLHIHCPDGAVSKDGPSAGAAITVAIYSLMSGRPINNTVAMTGEINLQGKITEIGGLEHKITGGIRAGIRKFLYPLANKSDLDKFMKKSADKSYMDGVEFVAVSTIGETFSHFFQ
jgi:ATP-dependent Lon protease